MSEKIRVELNYQRALDQEWERFYFVDNKDNWLFPDMWEERKNVS